MPVRPALEPGYPRCRGLVADDTTGRIVGLPLPKFFNLAEHATGSPYAPPLPDEPFEVYDKVDGSLAVVFHYAGRWHAASKGSFTSSQAVWAQRRLDAADTTGLAPGTTYLAEMLYPANRIVVNYGERRDLVLLAVFGPDGTEVPSPRPPPPGRPSAASSAPGPSPPSTNSSPSPSPTPSRADTRPPAPTPRASCSASPPACAPRPS